MKLAAAEALWAARQEHGNTPYDFRFTNFLDLPDGNRHEVVEEVQAVVGVVEPRIRRDERAKVYEELVDLFATLMNDQPNHRRVDGWQDAILRIESLQSRGD